MSTKYEITGFDDVFEELEKMEISDFKKRKVLNAAGDILIKGITPFLPKRSGKYRKELKKKIKKLDEGLSVIVSSSRFYDIFQEYGTSRQKQNVGSFGKGVTKTADEVVNLAVKELMP